MEKLRHSYEIELEKIKNELAIRADTAHELTERRLTAYSKIVGLVYRTRNMAREIANATEISQVLVEELAARTHELEENLYDFRIDLERDTVFVPIHTYKNETITFNKLLRDLNAYKSLRDEEAASKIVIQISSLFDDMEEQHRIIIEKLSTILSALEKRTSLI